MTIQAIGRDEEEQQQPDADAEQPPADARRQPDRGRARRRPTSQAPRLGEPRGHGRRAAALFGRSRRPTSASSSGARRPCVRRRTWKISSRKLHATMIRNRTTVTADAVAEAQLPEREVVDRVDQHVRAPARTAVGQAVQQVEHLQAR